MSNNSTRIESSNVLVSEPVNQVTESALSIGKRIQNARIQKNLDLNQLANDTGFSINFLTRIEQDESTPPVGVLLQISRALGTDFLENKPKNNRVDAYEKRTENYSYSNLSPGSENKHLKAFKVTIDPKSDHSGVGFQHEGEEFNYVLSGEVEVRVGDHVNILKTGESLHFNSSIKHNLRNLGDEKVELLVVIYSP